MTVDVPAPDINNEWRLETPGQEGWTRSARPDAADKFFIVSADSHVQEPNDFLDARVDPKYHDRLPGILFIGAGKGKKRQMAQKVDGFREVLRIRDIKFEGEDRLRNRAGREPEARIADLAADGVDAEILFPNKGLTIWATREAVLSEAMCRAYNDWAWETFADYNDRLVPMAAIAPRNLDVAIAEIQRCADLGFKGLVLPCKPQWGPPDHNDLNYNLKEFDPLWTAICEVDLPVTFHVSTGRDPRTSRSRGGAIINYAVHSLSPTMEPIINICASGVAEQFPMLRFGTIEAGIGWVAWALQAMDEAYLKHHMFVRPKLDLLPSEYFRRQGFASFQEDKVGLDLAQEHQLVDNFLWANDYPHHEGTWPHSPEAIERTMGHLTDAERARILGLNTAEIFKLPIPEQYLGHDDVAASAKKISAAS
jgi:predicted TIM-barrel fold metal-dependent hydrolase